MDRGDVDGEQHFSAEAWLKRNGQWLLLAVVVVAVALPRLSPFEGLNSYINVFQRFSEWVLGRLEVLFRDYGYAVVFFGVLLENSMFLGLLVPGSVILILAGLSAENGSIDFWYVLPLAVAGTLIGDTLSYMVGRLGLVRSLTKGSLAGPVEKVRVALEHDHRWMILAYHFAGYSRVVGPAAAGLFGIRYRRWAPLDYTGGAAWALTWLLVGLVLGMFGVEFGDTKTMVRLLEIVFTGMLIAAIVLTMWRTSRVRQGGQPAATPATAVIPVDRE